MPLFPDLILVMSLLCFIVLYALFKYSNTRPAYINRKGELAEQFHSVRTKSIKLQETVSNYILRYNANDTKFFDTITYGQYLRSLQINHAENLSEKAFVKLKNSNNRFFLRNTKVMLKKQTVILEEAQNKVSGL